VACDLVALEKENEHQFKAKTTASINSDTKAAMQILGLYSMSE